MMWKESYRIGVDAVDRQHIRLFQIVEELLRAIQADQSWEKSRENCSKVFSFLKIYVVMHFREEEAYQEQSGYVGLAEHRAIHQAFTEKVLDYERALVACGFERTAVQDFAGMLVSWLIYHVADADQRIVGKAAEPKKTVDRTHLGCFLRCAPEVLSQIAGLDLAAFQTWEIPQAGTSGDIRVKIGLTGDLRGDALFDFSPGFAFGLMKQMTMMEFDAVDDMVTSAMAEIANIISGSAATALEHNGLLCDITTPVVAPGGSDGVALAEGTVTISSSFGTLGISLAQAL